MVNAVDLVIATPMAVVVTAAEVAEVVFMVPVEVVASTVGANYPSGSGSRR